MAESCCTLGAALLRAASAARFVMSGAKTAITKPIKQPAAMHETAFGRGDLSCTSKTLSSGSGGNVVLCKTVQRWSRSRGSKKSCQLPHNVQNHRVATSDFPFDYARLRDSGAFSCYPTIESATSSVLVVTRSQGGGS